MTRRLWPNLNSIGVEARVFRVFMGSAIVGWWAGFAWINVKSSNMHCCETTFSRVISCILKVFGTRTYTMHRRKWKSREAGLWCLLTRTQYSALISNVTCKINMEISLHTCTKLGISTAFANENPLLVCTASCSEDFYRCAVAPLQLLMLWLL